MATEQTNHFNFVLAMSSMNKIFIPFYPSKETDIITIIQVVVKDLSAEFIFRLQRYLVVVVELMGLQR